MVAGSGIEDAANKRGSRVCVTLPIGDEDDPEYGSQWFKDY